MRTFIVAFVAGVCLLQVAAHLPPMAVVSGFAASGLLLFLLSVLFSAKKSVAVGRRDGRGIVLAARVSGIVTIAVAGALLGYAWAASNAQWRLHEVLPLSLEGKDLAISGVVATLPEKTEHGVRFELQVVDAPPEVSPVLPKRLRLSWYAARPSSEDTGAPDGDSGKRANELSPDSVRAGERWRFTVRLRRPHGTLNPNGFDYEAWLLERGVRATGYVRAGSAEQLGVLDASWMHRVTALRQDIRDRFYAALPASDVAHASDAPSEFLPYAPVLVALAIGDQSAIPLAQWQLYGKTGITHLVSISGLHVTMLAALAFGVTAVLWRGLARRGGRAASFLLRYPLPVVGACTGLLAATAYCALAGFAVPAQRTLYMLAAVACALISRRHVGVSRVLALALFAVVVIDPWAVLSAGFWLSFGAVGFLLLSARALPATSPAERSWQGKLLAGTVVWWRAQWALSVGMLPVLLALFGQFSLVSPVANAVAIPLISFVVTPLVLLATIPGCEGLLLPAHAITAAMMEGLQWLAQWPYAVWQQAAPPWWAVALATAGGVWMFLPGARFFRWLGVLCFLPLFLWQAPRPSDGEAMVRVLDVGQGLAVHVQTAAHDLIFDTGPAFSGDSDTGNRILVPYLRAAGVTALDSLVLSHGDADHVGGALSLLQSMPVRQVMHALTGDSPVLKSAMTTSLATPCEAGQVLEWDGVRLYFLHPLTAPDETVRRDPGSNPGRGTRRNTHACVLRVQAANGSVLLSSDIEAAQESVLVGRRHLANSAIQSDVLVVPHHGSRTSSTETFLDAVDARVAIFPVGYRNRFGHPRADVVERYEARHIELLRTDRDGALTIHLAHSGMTLERERLRGRRYWHDG